MKITVDVLKRAAMELNKVANPDPPIKIKSRSTAEDLTEEIIATAELLEKSDAISQETYDVLMELEVDVLAEIKIKNQKPTSKETKTFKPKALSSKGPGLKEELEKLLKEKKYTPEKIKELLTKKFPDKKPATISTILSDCKSEKWSPFGKPAKINKDGIMII
ncbi:MAG: hypothetical protein M0P71_12875 [Melioribacteraceae bacterium]|jgi:hypothetical protein|nr:hypothetical protein [Melioribacteraceae bacterium]